MSTDKSDIAIDFCDVSFSYDQDMPTISNLTFSISRGEYVSILGRNGSGKSTVAELADALLVPNSGNISIFGIDTASKDGAFAARQHIGYVFQDPSSQGVATLVKDEVAFGPENLGLSNDEIDKRVWESLKIVGMSELVEADVNTLSGGQMQRVAVASAIAMQPDILILDEATSMLDEDSAGRIIDIVKQLNTDGMTILNITHNRSEAEMSSRIIVMDKGSISYDGAPNDDILSSVFPPLPTKAELGLQTHHNADIHSNNENTDVINIKNVWFSYSLPSQKEKKRRDQLLFSTNTYALENTSLHVAYGESVAIMGSNGSGKSTLVKLMNGLLHPTCGTVLIKGIDTKSKDGANIARTICGLCFQFPERQLFSQSVYADIAFGPNTLGLTEAEIDIRVRNAMEDMGLDFDIFASRSPFSLSGGEQRRVAIAGILAMQPEVLILDEPCSGLDSYTHAAFLKIIAKLILKGTTIVLVTHNIHDANVLTDRTIKL